jgi:hypothetical protein
MGPRTGLDDMEKRREKSRPYRDSNSNLSAVQPVANRYTDCAIRLLNILYIIRLIIRNRDSVADIAAGYGLDD